MSNCNETTLSQVTHDFVEKWRRTSWTVERLDQQTDGSTFILLPTFFQTWFSFLHFLRWKTEGMTDTDKNLTPAKENLKLRQRIMNSQPETSTFTPVLLKTLTEIAHLVKVGFLLSHCLHCWEPHKIKTGEEHPFTWAVCPPEAGRSALHSSSGRYSGKPRLSYMQALYSPYKILSSHSKVNMTFTSICLYWIYWIVECLRIFNWI